MSDDPLADPDLPTLVEACRKLVASYDDRDARGVERAELQHALLEIQTLAGRLATATPDPNSGLKPHEGSMPSEGAG
jgi:hypothetical protein